MKICGQGACACASPRVSDAATTPGRVVLRVSQHYRFISMSLISVLLTDDMGTGRVLMRATKRKRASEDVDRGGRERWHFFQSLPSVAVEGKFDFQSWNA